MSNDRDLTEGSIFKNLLNLAGPMVFGIVAVISVSLVDTFFVGKLGTAPLAALSFSFPVSLSITSLSIGLSAGAASVVSRAIGAKDRRDAKRLATDSLVLSSILVIIVTAIGYVTIRPLFSLLGAEGEVLDMIVRYMQIWYLSMPFLVVPMVANAIVRALGDALWPSAIMVGSAIINIASTPLLIFGWGPIPAFDIEGAAWGTFVARVFTLFFALWLVIYREKIISFARPPIEELINSWKRVLAVGIPAGFGNAVNPIGIAIVTGFLATYGEATVAAFGVATRIESFAVIPMLALSSAIGPFSGQNWGNKNVDRVIGALKQSLIVCFGWALFLAGLFWFLAEPIAALFASEDMVAKTAANYLIVVPLSVWGYGWVIVVAGCFNSIGKSVTGLGFYLTRTAALYVPLSFAASLFAESWWVFVAIAISNALSGALVAAYAFWWLNKQK